MNWDERIKKENLQFRHLYRDGRLWATICHDRITKKTNPRERIAFGVAVCSDKDTPLKEAGRQLSHHKKHTWDRFHITCKEWEKFLDGSYSFLNEFRKKLSGQCLASDINDLMAYYYNTHGQKRNTTDG